MEPNSWCQSKMKWIWVKKLLRKLFYGLPYEIQLIACKILPGERGRIQYENVQREKWVRKSYSEFGKKQREYIFMSIARFCHINRPLEGYYFEFGSHEGNTMRMAWDHFHNLFDWEYVAFDSFEGLPEVAEIDQQEIWEKGKLKTEESEFIKIVTRHGLKAAKLMTVKGFYEESLIDELAEKLLPKKAVVIYIDCDLYASTVPVLRFVKPFIQKGTIIVFDDWYCFHGDPNKGERRAFHEFTEANPELEFEPFVHTNEAQSFVFVGRK